MMASIDTEHLVVGGGIGGYQAAKRLLKLEPSSRVILVSDEPVPPYNLPYLSKEYLTGKKTEGEMFFAGLDHMSNNGAQLRLSDRVIGLEPTAHAAVCRSGLRINYKSAYLSPGARPLKLSVPGHDLPGVCYLRTIEDARELKRGAQSAQRAVVIGAGFVGIEVAASLRQLGLDVTIVEARERIWPRFGDVELASYVQRRCEIEGIRFRLDERVAQLRGTSHLEGVVCESGTCIDAQLACVGIGVEPNTDLAIGAGLRVSDGIVVDEFLRTSAKDVYAGGDAVSYLDPVTGQRRRSQHWGHAEYCGQIAAANMVGRATKYDFMSYMWSDVFDMHFEAAGNDWVSGRTIVRSEAASNSRISMYLRDDALAGFTGVNAAQADVSTLRKWIRSHRDLSGIADILGDASIALRSL